MPKDAGEKVCAECGSGFTCGFAAGEGTCWCFDRPRVLPVDGSRDCLCPECLDRAIARELEERKKFDDILKRGKK